jgi:hypothetical protein
MLGAGMRAKGTYGGGAVNSQNWTGVRKFASLHKGPLPHVRALLFLLITHVPIALYTVHCKSAPVLFIFSPLQINKINHVTELQNMRFFLGPLAWLKTTNSSKI